MFTFIQFRSSSPDIFFKKGVLKNFAWRGIICNRSQESCRPPGFPLKRIMRHRCFLMNFAKFLRTRFFCKTRKNACFYQLLDFGNFQCASFKMALGFRKLRSSKRLKFWKLFLFWELHHEKTFFYGGKKRRFFPLFSLWNCLLLR